ncbi:LamG-like jellyroll fold domain-containing protein [Actinacidiphila guanduensis]|uniref:Concanavalin A-like lectin/glucanases superfamily protein n=1 Tax=Actinacidiphila guanduensis TaxID=310781 RepID=A0A1H0NB01_9ACTN|nr:LamG-like jellyroll fold domain-containing protein [Actinacidiphila guanduensis]SDO89899.1 Concanavalin A-like lectin/glucanases superfamily protein [Actinacidiphila guanduensis]
MRTAAVAALALLASAALALPASAAPAQPDTGTGQDNYSSGQSAPVTPATPADPAVPRLDDGYGPDAAQSQAMQKAAAEAADTGQPVAVDSLTTPEQQVTALPGGGFQLNANPEPVRARKAGAWVPVDTALHQAPDGRWAPSATAYGTVSFSAGGDTALVTSSYAGTAVTIRWPHALPAPEIDGATATYPDVLPSVDLKLTATSSGGFSDVLVVKSPAAAARPDLATLELATSVTGGTLHHSGNGLRVADHAGNEVMSAATPLMWDSNTTLPANTSHSAAASRVPTAADPSDAAHAGLAAHIAPVMTSVSGSRLTLTPQQSLLTARTTVFPVYIDPTFNWHPSSPGAPAFDEVKQGCPGTSFYNSTGKLADNGNLGVGYNGWAEGDCNTGDEHAIYQWKLSSTLFGAHINSATVEATEVFTAACSGTYPVNLHWSGGIGSGTDWSNRPKYNSYSTSVDFARGYNPDLCPSAGDVSHGFNVLTPIKADASGHSASFTATLSEDSTESSRNDFGFSRFSHNPSLQIEYNTKPSVPSAATMAAISGADDAACDTTAPYPYMGKTLASTPPILEAKVSDKDADKLRATFQYWVDGSTTKATGLSNDNLSSGTYAKFSLPASFVSSLTNGKTVDWQAEVTDGEDSTTFAQSPTCHFTAEPTAPDAPTVTSENDLYPNTDQDGGVGAAAGTAGTFDVATAGGASAAKFVWSLDVPPPTSNPPAAQTVPASSGKGQISATPYAPGPHTLWVYAVDAAGDDSGTTGYPFLATGDPGSTCSTLSACFDNTAISADTATAKADIDGSGDSFSATDLANAGWTSGGKVTVDGATFTLPAFGSGQKDNVLADNQTVGFSGSGSALEFLLTATDANLATPGAIDGDQTAPYVPEGTEVVGSYCFDGTTPNGPCAATGSITYTDGTSVPYVLTVPNWWDMGGSLPTVVLPHRNDATGTHASPHGLFAFSVPTNPGKTIASVTLPDVGNHIGFQAPTLHIFGMATRNTTAGTPEATGTTAAAPDGQSWTGAWANPNEGQYNFQGTAFSNQTFRVALKPSLSGGTVRVKLDNALGASKLTIGHATVAVDSGSESPSPIPAGAPATLKFGGAQSVTIPAGGSVYSDPLGFSVTAGQYLLVSYQLSNSVPYLVQHSFANTAYEYLTAVGAGDKTTDTTGTPFAEQWNGWYTDLVTNLDVISAGTPTQAVLGDGLIDAFQPNTHPVTNGTRVSDALADAEPTTPHPYGTIAEGIESNDLMTDNPQTYNGNTVGGPAVLSRIDRDLLDQPGISNVVITEGLEDLLQGTTSDALESNGYTALVQQLQGWGIATTIASLTPCEGYGGSGATPDDPCTADTDTNRTAVNDWLSGMPLGTPWDTAPVYNADFDTALAVPDSTTGEEKLATAADTGDHVNLTDAGYAAETLAIISPHDTWNFDDGDGFTLATDTAPTDTPTTANDTTTGVGAEPLTLAGTTTWTDDPTRGETLTFDGATGEADSTGPALDTTGSYSLSAWVKLSSLPAHNATVAAQSGTVNSPFYLQYNYTAAGAPGWALSFTKADTASPGFWTAATTGATTSWTHLVGTYNATTHTARLYVNGTLAATATGVTSWNATGPFTAGHDQYNGADGDHLPGAISDLQAWNYTLDPNQVTALYQQIP